MDKTIEIIIAATVIIMTALTVMFMVGGQSGDFQNWLNDTQGDAECSLQKTELENTCTCGSSEVQEEAQQIIAEAQSCDWTENINDCDDVC